MGCVMGFVERCSVSGVKQAQSRALPDAMGTSGLVSLSLCTHAHMQTYNNVKTQNYTDSQAWSTFSYNPRQNFSGTCFTGEPVIFMYSQYCLNLPNL